MAGKEQLGRRTRHVNAQHKANKVPKLPLHLSTLPRDRARPTPRHPSCNTQQSQYGMSLHLHRQFTVTEMLGGAGLQPPRAPRRLCTYKVVRNGHTLGTCSLPQYGLAWCMALARHGLDDARLEVR